MTYDEKCYDLAALFLADEGITDPAVIDALAKQIQVIIEGFTEFDEVGIAAKAGASKFRAALAQEAALRSPNEQWNRGEPPEFNLNFSEAELDEISKKAAAQDTEKEGD